MEHLYKPKRNVETQDEANVPLILDDERYKYCLPFQFLCPDEKCRAQITVKNLIEEFVSSMS